MYTLIIILWLALSGWLLYRGIRNKKYGTFIAGVFVAIAAYLFFQFMDFWGEMLWFRSLGYNKRFWTLFLTKVMFGTGSAVIGWVILTLITLPVPEKKKLTRRINRGGGALIGFIWGISNWSVILKFFYGASTGTTDPILGRDTGFYLFTLPFLDAVYALLLLFSLLSVISILAAGYLRFQDQELEFRSAEEDRNTEKRLYHSVIISLVFLIFVLGYGKFVNRYHLLYSSWGAVTGAGWTDVHIRLPAYWVAAATSVIAGLFLLLPAAREKLTSLLESKNIRRRISEITTPAVVFASMLILWFLALTVVPGLFQWLRVEPNEITFEKPYISNNIEFTRLGFGLDKVEVREYPASEKFTKETVQENQKIFDNIRLWDWRALDAVYKQFQEIRLYYEFVDVDIDRYTIQDAYRQVMIAAREMELDNLPEQSQTFVNKRFKYTHGNGITLNTVHDFTPDGLPNLLVKDIPPVSKHPSLEVSQPRIYYGELTLSHVIVNSEEEELDYPSGEKNVYIRYDGDGGVQIRNLWRKFLFGWKFDGTRLFLSSYPREESRIMFHRQIRERVQTLAPFLKFDKDPYIVLSEGNLYWIIDGYTTSSSFPYSEPISGRESIEYRNNRNGGYLMSDVGGPLAGINYIRNSVKVVLDAFEGTVDFYVFEPDDPIIRVWKSIFPNLFKEKNAMPESLMDHIRYPVDMLLIQGLVYAKYHMSDPTVFYNQEDLWVRATEKYYDHVQPVEPYYVMWELPESDEPEFVLILPFTPKNRQVLIGWIAGMCDPGNYGRFLAYKFPKEKRILGPQQVETKIDQDRVLSGQLTLWDQRGSNVIRGNVLAIPIGETLLYVEPIYLQAETAAYPELRLVALMHGDTLSYAETFDKALQGLLEGVKPETLPAAGAPPASLESLIQQADQSFQNYLNSLGQKKFNDAAEALQKLQQALDRLSEMPSKKD